MQMTLYGLKNCDTCKKALKALDDAGHSVDFIDIRAEADLGVSVPTWLAAAGKETLVNRRSTTWRNLDNATRDRDPAALLVDHPTLIKRPVIETQDQVYVGWAKDVQAALLD
ncbi:MAG: ArsC/Spx/MgsR family protein [Pseudomonadota bacterium]